MNEWVNGQGGLCFGLSKPALCPKHWCHMVSRETAHQSHPLPVFGLSPSLAIDSPLYRHQSHYWLRCLHSLSVPQAWFEKCKQRDHSDSAVNLLSTWLLYKRRILIWLCSRCKSAESEYLCLGSLYIYYGRGNANLPMISVLNLQSSTTSKVHH